MKKTLLLFAALLTLGMTASAQNPNGIPCFQDGDWLYAINPDAEHEVTVVHYCGEEGSEATELTIPSYVTTDYDSRYFVTALGESLFSDNSWQSLDEYTQEWRHDTFTKLEKVTIPNSVTTIGNYAFQDCTGLTSVTIPNSVTTIGEFAFNLCTGLTSVTIPNSVTKIDERAFYLCTGLTSVTIPNSVTEIGEGVFSYCTGLTSVTIPNSVTIIGKAAFKDCTGLTSVTIPNSVTTIGELTFNNCTGLTSVTIGSSVTEIGEGAFKDCTGLTSVTIPNSVITIGDEAFFRCTGLTSVTIGNSVTIIGTRAFNSCKGLTSVTFPNSLTEIEEEAFGGTGLTSVTIPNSVTEIGNSAFIGTDLTSVTIGSSVTHIGVGAFMRCTGLATIYALPATPPACDGYVFYLVPETVVVYIPKGSFKAYFVADGWSHFTDFREMGALDITLSESAISIEEGETATLTATVTKDDEVTVESETWSTSNPEVATVADGVVTAVSEGTATITYTAVDGYGVPHTESCEVTVTEQSGIEYIEANGSDTPAEYFNLNGIRVANPENGLYIKRQGGKATKVLIK